MISLHQLKGLPTTCRYIGISCHLHFAYPAVNTLNVVSSCLFFPQSHSHKSKKAARNVPQQLVNPGEESYRRLLEEGVRYLLTCTFSVVVER